MKTNRCGLFSQFYLLDIVVFVSKRSPPTTSSSKPWVLSGVAGTSRSNSDLVARVDIPTIAGNVKNRGQRRNLYISNQQKLLPGYRKTIKAVVNTCFTQTCSRPSCKLHGIYCKDQASPNNGQTEAKSPSLVNMHSNQCARSYKENVPWRHPARYAIHVAGLTGIGVVMHKSIIIIID